MPYTCHPPAARRSQRGIALMLVLMVIAILTILGATLLATESLSTPMARRGGERLQARMIAEAALAMTMEHLKATPSWRSTLPDGLWVENQALNGGRFTLYGEDGAAPDTHSPVIGDGSLSNNPADPVTLTVIGVSGSARHIARATLTPLSNSAIAVSERLEVRNSGLIDSYNSAAGPYSTATATQKAVVSSNDTGRPSVTLRNAARVNGNILVGPGGTPAAAVQRLDSATLSGTVSGMISEVAIPRPVEPAMPASLGNQTFSSGTQSISGDVHYGNLTLNGTAILSAGGNCSVMIDGDLRIEDDAVVELGGSVTYAAAVSGTIEAEHQAMVDSYDSSRGAYSKHNSGSNAVLAANRTSADTVKLVHSAEIRGNVYVGAGANPDMAIVVDEHADVTGVRSVLTQPIVLPSPPPWPGNVGSSIGDYNKSGGTHTISSNLQVGAFKLNSHAVVRISGHRVIRVNKELVVDGHASIEILPDSSLTIYVGQSCTFTDQSEVNVNTKDPSRLVIYAKGSGYEIAIKKQAKVHAVIDAPSSWMSIDDNGKFFGSFMGTRLLLTHQAEFHHDQNPAVVAVNPRLPLASGAGSGTLTFYTRGSVTIGSRAKIDEAGANPSSVTFHHLSDKPIDLAGDCVVHGSINAPDASFTARERARLTGKVRAVDVTLRDSSITATDGSGGASNPGIVADQSVEMSGSAVLNASTGASVLAVNRASIAVVYLRDTARVEGNALGGPGGNTNRDIRVQPTSLLRGTRGNLPNAVSIGLPAAPAVSGSAADYLCVNSMNATLSSDLVCDNFEIRDDAHVTITGRVTIIVNGSFRIRDRGQLTLASGASATIWFKGVSEVAGEAKVNLDGRSGSLVLHNHGVTAVELRDRAKICAHIVSPLADSKVTAQAHLFGSFKGRRLTVESQGQVHHDLAGPMGMKWIEN